MWFFEFIGIWIFSYMAIRVILAGLDMYRRMDAALIRVETTTIVKDDK